MENLPVQTSKEIKPSALLEMAVSKDLDINKLEKLMELQERWEKTEARKKFLTAISEFQYSCPQLEKSKAVDFTSQRTGGRTSYKYAPLGEIASTIKKPMKENGLSHRWEIEEKEDKIICTCFISHIDGHSEKTTMSGIKDDSGGKNTIQQRGSTITYLQRYTLIAALGISTADEDNDASGPVTEKKAPTNNGPADERPWIQEKQLHEAITRMKTGEAGIYEKTVNAYRVRKSYKEELDKAHKAILPAKPVENGARPEMTEQLLQQAIKRIMDGKTDVIANVKKAFKITDAQIKKLENAEQLARS